MKEVVVILHREAIHAAQQICAGLSDYEVLLCDPELGDPVAAAGLRNVQLFTTLGGPSFKAMHQEAHLAALSLETELDAAQRADTGISVIGWQHLNLYYMMIALRWYTGLWERLGSRLLQHKVHLPISDNPAEYYFNSFVPAVVLVCYLQRHGSAVTTYDYGARGARLYPVPDFQGSTHGGDATDLLIHLPTCVYDIDYFREELRASGRNLINLESRYWNLPLEARVQIRLTDLQPALTKLALPAQKQVAAFTDALRENLARLLTPYIGLPNYCARQADHLLQLYRSQLLTYLELQRYFHAAGPAKLLLSEHDSGFQGPLITFARNRSLPVILLPHSKVCADIEFAHADIVALTHPMQARPIHDAEGNTVPHRAIRYPERFIGTSVVGEGLRTISLMLNSLSLSGVPFAPADVYLDGIKRIVSWCRDHEVTLKVRCKPGYTLFRPLSVYVGLDADTLAHDVNEPMDEHLGGCDLCLMYDYPTTGALHCLRNSIPLLNPVVTDLAASQLVLSHSDVVPPEDLDVCLQRLDDFMATPSTLYDFRDSQFQAYLALFGRTQPLRNFL